MAPKRAAEDCVVPYTAPKEGKLMWGFVSKPMITKKGTTKASDKLVSNECSKVLTLLRGHFGSLEEALANGWRFVEFKKRQQKSQTDEGKEDKTDFHDAPATKAEGPHYFVAPGTEEALSSRNAFGVAEELYAVKKAKKAKKGKKSEEND